MNTIHFLCTGNYYRSRFSELYFNHLAKCGNLPWRADSSGLALERGRHNIGPMNPDARELLMKLGVTPDDSFLRFPREAVSDDFSRAQMVIALDEEEHRPLMNNRFPDWENNIIYWNVHDLDQTIIATALMSIKAEVESLVKNIASV